VDEPVIKAVGVTKRYESVLAVDHVDIAVGRGVTAALLGGNGAGKTTTLSMLLGLLIPTSGTVEVLGVDMARRRYDALPRMNFSSPYVELPNRLTVKENLTVFGRLYGVRRLRQSIAALAESLALTPLLDRPIGRLSAGQKTRVALAKALLNEPEVLLLDEPTASLDPDTADWVRGFLESYRARTGATILLASHNMAEVERLCHSVMMMRAGKIVDRGAPQELIARYGRRTLEEVFLDIARAPHAGPPDTGAPDAGASGSAAAE
jgi:ABC-2 type transport system ATP-binding protein